MRVCVYNTSSTLSPRRGPDKHNHTAHSALPQTTHTRNQTMYSADTLMFSACSALLVIVYRTKHCVQRARARLPAKYDPTFRESARVLRYRVVGKFVRSCRFACQTETLVSSFNFEPALLHTLINMSTIRRTRAAPSVRNAIQGGTRVFI